MNFHKKTKLPQKVGNDLEQAVAQQEAEHADEAAIERQQESAMQEEQPAVLTDEVEATQRHELAQEGAQSAHEEQPAEAEGGETAEVVAEAARSDVEHSGILSSEQIAEEIAEGKAAEVESTADTVEQILEEHGLTSSDQITEEIAEEIMAVHTAHDEDAKVVVAVDGLYKKYSKKADWAVSNVNFHCYEGEIVGLLGHNGAGKSTTLKCLEGMLPFDKGTISICDRDIVKDPIKAKANMGFVTDNHAVFVKMTGMQYLAFMADVYNVPTDVRKQRVEELEEVFQLGHAVNNLISSYSHGMRQKICMMGSLMHHPKLWVLDEPMTGLDPRTMHAVQMFMRSYADAGNCIIFSSHALITVAKMCDRVVLLRTGCQLDDLNIKRIMTVDPTFDFEEYFLKHERQD